MIVVLTSGKDFEYLPRFSSGKEDLEKLERVFRRYLPVFLCKSNDLLQL
jgi:hypothetical protein